MLNAQLHNADQLSGFLLRYVATHFQVFEKTEQFQKLTGENLSYVREHQRPQLFHDSEKEKRGDEEESNSSKPSTSTAKDSCVVM